MRRGEIWWAVFDERRPVVLLSDYRPYGFRVMQVVAPADADISGLGIEVAVGVRDGLPFDGVLRFGFRWPGVTPCTWLTTLSREDLIERAGALSAAKLTEIDDALRASEQTADWTPAAAARLSEMKASLRQRAQGSGERPEASSDAHRTVRLGHDQLRDGTSRVPSGRSEAVACKLETEQGNESRLRRRAVARYRNDDVADG
jgi:mRNA interferase MazF